MRQRRVYDLPGWRRLRRVVLVRDGFRCRYCGGLANTADHVVPLADGGAPLDPANVVACCQSCNSERGAATAAARRNRVFKQRGRSSDAVTGSTGTQRASVASGRRVVYPGAIRSD